MLRRPGRKKKTEGLQYQKALFRTSCLKKAVIRVSCFVKTIDGAWFAPEKRIMQAGNIRAGVNTA